MNFDLLITEIFARHCLWNIFDKNYHNRILVDKMWAEISNKVRFPIDECKRKWKNLRDRFRIELKKDAPGKSGSLSSNWHYYNQLQFLKAVMGTSKNAGNVLDVDNKNDNRLPTPHRKDRVEAFDTLLDVPTTSKQNFAETTNIHSLSSEKRRKRKTKKTVKQKKVMLLEHLEKILLSDSKESEDLLFFKSLLGYMESFSRLQKLRVRNKITNVILDELASKSRTSTPESI